MQRNGYVHPSMTYGRVLSKAYPCRKQNSPRSRQNAKSQRRSLPESVNKPRRARTRMLTATHPNLPRKRKPNRPKRSARSIQMSSAKKQRHRMTPHPLLERSPRRRLARSRWRNHKNSPRLRTAKRVGRKARPRLRTRLRTKVLRHNNPLLRRRRSSRLHIRHLPSTPHRKSSPVLRPPLVVMFRRSLATRKRLLDTLSSLTKRHACMSRSIRCSGNSPYSRWVYKSNAIDTSTCTNQSKARLL